MGAQNETFVKSSCIFINSCHFMSGKEEKVHRKTKNNKSGENKKQIKE
jgi:hypothetical protein